MRTNHDFTRQLDRNEEGQILVKSTCIYCGTSTLGSVLDGSLDQWEEAHDCKAKPHLRKSWT
jgi:hypothetical protein